MKITRAGYDQMLRAPAGRIAFTGAAGRGAAGDIVTVYTITGRVALYSGACPFVSEALVSTINLGTISLGITSVVDFYIVATTVGAGDFALNDWWLIDGSTTPGIAQDYILRSAGGTSGVPQAISQDLIITCSTQNITDGQLDFDGLWYRPLTAGSGLVLGPNMTAI